MLCGAEELKELQQKEKEMKVQPDWEIDAFTKAQIRSGKRHSIVTDLILKLLGLDVRFESHLPPAPCCCPCLCTPAVESHDLPLLAAAAAAPNEHQLSYLAPFATAGY